MKKNFFYKQECRLCKSKNLQLVLNLGNQPLANSYLKNIDDNEIKYPLELMSCLNCGHNQLSIVVDPDILYKNYLYVSGTPQTFHMHCQDLANKYTEILNLREFDLVVDIAGNDGTLLSKFINQDRFINVVSIDPAKNLANIARDKGIDVFSLFFNSKVAKAVKNKYNKKAKLITAQNVFAHIDDLDEFMRGIDILLDDDGILVLEFPYAIDMFNRNAFDTIYHEHLSYFQLDSLEKFFLNKDYNILGINYYKDIHGGTIRLSIVKFPVKNNISNKFKSEMDEYQNLLMIDRLYTFEDKLNFAKRVQSLKRQTLDLFKQIYENGEKIHFFGAAAKFNTLSNFFIDDNYKINSLCYDENHLKLNLYLPGTHIKIEDPRFIKFKDIDYLYIGVWNFKDELIKRIRENYQYAGKFIIGIPNIQII